MYLTKFGPLYSFTKEFDSPVLELARGFSNNADVYRDRVGGALPLAFLYNRDKGKSLTHLLHCHHRHLSSVVRCTTHIFTSRPLLCPKKPRLKI